MESCIGVVSPKSSGRRGKIKKANCALPTRMSHQDKRAGQGWQWDLTPQSSSTQVIEARLFRDVGVRAALELCCSRS